MSTRDGDGDYAYHADDDDDDANDDGGTKSGWHTCHVHIQWSHQARNIHIHHHRRIASPHGTGISMLSTQRGLAVIRRNSFPRRVSWIGAYKNEPGPTVAKHGRPG